MAVHIQLANGDAMRARLIPTEGGIPVELVKDLTLIGRGDDCDLQIDHKSVSKRHCILVKTDGLVLIRDLGSTNGTRVNGQRVRRGSLLPNDDLSVANFRFTLKFGDGQSEAEREVENEPTGLAVQRNQLPDAQ